jgi:alpha-N-arabinofuranosidase
MPHLFAPLKRLSLLAFACPAIAFAQSVTVSINAGTTLRTVDERIFGLNAVLWDPQTSSDQTINLLKAADIRAIRVPGGSLSDEYHWRTNTNLANTWTWSAGFHNFTRLISGLDAQAFVTVNYGTGTPEEAAAWVAYANASPTTTPNSINHVIGPDSKGYDWQTAAVWANLRGAAPLGTNDGMNFLRIGRSAAIGIKYWEIGNENYGPWETDEQAVKNDPTTYANRAQLYISKMKAVDPTIKVGVVAVATRENASYKNWTPVMLARLKALGVTPDFLIYHRYEQAPAADQPGNPETDAGLLQKAKTWPEDAADLRKQLVDHLGAVEAAKVEIVVTENNSVYAKPGKQTTSLVNGLYHADSVGNLLQTEINALLWWDLRNGQDFANNNSASLYGWRGYGDYGILSSPSSGGSSGYYDPYPTYYVMKLLSRFARKGDTVVAATSNNSLLSVFAVRSIEGPLNLLVINKDPSVTREANIAVAGYTVPAAANIYAYGKSQDDAAKPGGSGSTDIASSIMSIAGATFTASFAPYSVTVISLDAKVAPPTPTPPTTPPSTPTPPTAPSSSGSGGGGGAPSLWFMGGLILLAAARRTVRSPR